MCLKADFTSEGVGVVNKSELANKNQSHNLDRFGIASIFF